MNPRPLLFRADDEVRRMLPKYNLARALMQSHPDCSAPCLEREVSEYIRVRDNYPSMDRHHPGITIPAEALLAARATSMFGTTAQHLVPDSFSMPPMASWLSPAVALFRAGIRVLTPKGTIKVAASSDAPGFTPAAVGEADEIAAQMEPNLGSVRLQPGRTIRARFDASWTLLNNADPAGSAAINAMLMESVGFGLEQQIFHGAGGADEIEGILASIEVDEEITDLSYPNVRKLLRAPFEAGAIGDASLLTSTLMRDRLLETGRQDGWDRGIAEAGESRLVHVDGNPVLPSAALPAEPNAESPSTTTLHRLIAMDARRAVVCALFSPGVTVLQDVYSLGSVQTARLIAFLDADASLVQPAAARQALIDLGA